MNIYVYSDESGVLDKKHNPIYTFGGLVFCSQRECDDWARKYHAVEKLIRQEEELEPDEEVKAARVSNKAKASLYRSLNRAEKFGVVVQQKKLLDILFTDKKSKQRYLDWVYKMGIKTKLETMIREKKIVPGEVRKLYFFTDEHSTATNGLYELEQSLEQEFKRGTYNSDWRIFHPPIFENLTKVEVQYCNSAVKTLVRAADIVANHIFHAAIANGGTVEERNGLKVFYHP